MNFFQILIVASPGSYAQNFFLNFEKKNVYDYFSFSLKWDPMGTKISKRYSSYNLHPKVFQLFLNFLLNGPNKSTFGIFEILRIFSKISNSPFVAYLEIENSIIWKRAIVEKKMEGNLGLMSSTYIGCLWPF